MKRILFLLLFYGSVSVSVAEELEDFKKEYQQYEVSDSLPGYDKMIMEFNIGFYTYVMRPALKGYNAITSSFVRSGVRNFLDSLPVPFRVVGNVLQLKFDNAGNELKHFIANSITGFGGLRDIASEIGIEKHPADSGLVLAHWEMGEGFHIVLPILGPSNLRDTLSLPTLWYATPTTYIEPGYASFLVGAYGFANELSFHLGEIDKIYYNMPNLYPFLRDAYKQRRKKFSK